MKGERIYMALDNINDELLERYEEGTKCEKKRDIGIRYGAIAACLCIVMTGIFAFHLYLGENGIGAAQGGNKVIPNGTTGNYSSSAGQVYKADGTVVSSFASNLSSSYGPPQNGTWFYFAEATDALKEYAGKDVTYFLAVDIFANSKPLDVNSEKLTAELKRLSKQGYHVGYAEAWTYQGEGEKVPYTYVAGYFTAEELQSFKASKDLGYAFRFATNGDGSSVSSDQGIVCNFDGERNE